MKRTLAIDAGNTSVKLSVWEGEEFAGGTTLADFDPKAIAGFAGKVDRAIVCAVRPIPSEAIKELDSDVAPTMLFTHDTPVPLVNGYHTPQTLGLDRLAGAVGARADQPRGTLLIADLGTAATFDYLRGNDIFVGGNIAPGLAMRLQAMHEHTAQLPMPAIPVEADPVDILGNPFGHDTMSALKKGVVLGLVAELTYYRQLLGYASHVVLTGGDAPLIAPLVSFPVTVDPHLVGRGLNRILLYNEK